MSDPGWWLMMGGAAALHAWTWVRMRRFERELRDADRRIFERHARKEARRTLLALLDVRREGLMRGGRPYR